MLCRRRGEFNLSKLISPFTTGEWNIMQKKNRDESAYILMDDQRQNVTWGASMTVCQSASQLVHKELEDDRKSMMWHRARTAGSRGIYLTLMFYLLAFCRAGCLPGHPERERGRSPISGSNISQVTNAYMCVQRLHPFSLPHKIYKSSRHIKAVLGRRG